MHVPASDQSGSTSLAWFLVLSTLAMGSSIGFSVDEEVVKWHLPWQSPKWMASSWNCFNRTHFGIDLLCRAVSTMLRLPNFIKNVLRLCASVDDILLFKKHKFHKKWKKLPQCLYVRFILAFNSHFYGLQS